MTLKQAITEYKEDHLYHLLNEEEFYKSLSKEQAIIFAAKGLDPYGKMNRHQRRLGRKICEEAAKKLSRFEDDIITSNSFGSLFAITEKIRKTPSLGDLWSYDTALRIGFNKGIYPDSVFLQCGAMEGAKQRLKLNRITERQLPPERFEEEVIEGLRSFEMENYLCVGKRRNWFK